jgi:ribosomal protein S18 acetylase RimI-like enzyme
MTIASSPRVILPSAVHPVRVEETPEIVDIHLASFPGFFLTFLGRRFLALLYEQIQQDDEGVVLVTTTDGRIAGFVAGVLHQGGFYQRLVKRKKWKFVRAAFGAVLRRPAIVPRLVRALQRPAEAQRSAADACLMSIAVRPEAAGQRIGQQLVRAFCGEMWQRGAPTVCLTTDRDNNERTNRFYQQLGFQLSSTFVTPEGRAMNEYVISLPLKD